MTAPACPFCAPDRPLLAESELAIAFADGRPVSPGHTLVLPRRHVATYFDCTPAEKAALWELVERARALLASSHRPDAYNVGLNIGVAAGQTVMHAHIHVIPRYTGDVADPRGGVRNAVMTHQPH
jgi:diadenosine tetraphosphate (Ap4A) HIT family hydrolase